MPQFRRFVWPFAILLVITLVLVATYPMISATPANRPLSVAPGDQEIAWFHTATNTATWERFVAGAHYAARIDPNLHVDDSRAFPEMTTAIPEVVLTNANSNERLRFRWYKQSGGVQMADWVKALAARNPAPLAIIGGGSSDRALELARIMESQKEWHGTPPLLLFTTATARHLEVELEGTQFHPFDLMSVYPGRSFRFCFNNRQMADAVVDFVWHRTELRPQGSQQALLGAIVDAISGNSWGAIAMLAAQEDLPGEVYTLEWRDDPYSVDLAQEFRDVLVGEPRFEDEHRPHHEFELDELNRPWFGHVQARALLDIHSSVGTFIRPNSGEATAISGLINGSFVYPPISRDPFQRSLLILPTVPEPARRILSGITGASPVLRRHLVAVSGDSISFNHVYRDGALIWNVRLVSVPLVFFAHQNPVAWDSEDTKDTSNRSGLYPPNGTDDVLHFADVVSIVADAAYGSPGLNGERRLLTDSDQMSAKMQNRTPKFFDEEGNRKGGSGEYIVYLRPHYGEGTEVPSAVIEVWTHDPNKGWQLVRDPLDVRYR
jgi:hypothetical protein